MVNICYSSIIWTIIFSILVISVMADYLDDESFGLADNPSWLENSEPEEGNGNLINPEEDQIVVDRRGFNRYLSKHKGVIPYYLHRDGINYGGRPGPASTRLWGSRLYGMSRMRPSFGLVSVNSRSGPFGAKK
ncbi:Hypothetical predicted protein [Mytilus galloprovincialis]|uniref:Uncharacterized protein n=1 Tax=Mytilus galloprovincialis TaxID=29158 RepID=A0A8B6GL80_MYTGA|nr:Hypothetical predicted protein [Mytilus galloprovincialis]